ncbi:MAG: OmpA family protein [Desulfatibacillaceae bacterium]
MLRHTRSLRIVAIVLVLGLAALGCANQQGGHSKTTKGTAIGTAAGAALGAAIGSAQGEVGKGAAIGGLAGAAIGAGVGYKLDQQAKELSQIPNTQVERQPDRVVVTMDNSILFETNSSSLTGSAQQTLNKVAEVMVKYPETQIIIKGHTDSTGSEQYNQQLSERRAGMVKNYLVAEGVPSHRITAIGFGESVPVASNDTASGRAANRRVEIEVKPTGQQQ